MKSLRSLALFAALAPCAICIAASSPGPVPEAAAKPKKTSGFVFSLLPISLQKNPKLDFNVITELTPEGRKLPVPSREKPVFFVAQASPKPYNTGVGAEHGIKSPPPQKLEQLMEKALAESGYLPSDETPARPPSIAIIYQWGSSSFQPPENIETTDADGNATTMEATPELVIRETLMDRAQLLGGKKFAQEVAHAIMQVDQKAAMSGNPAAGGGGLGGTGTVGDMMQDPFEELRMRTPEMGRLVDELFSSSFFVVASAYDYEALAKGQRRLLWRTKMTVNSIGVNMIETVPPLIASAAPYFGRDMPDPVVITKRVSREGKVEVGAPVVVPDSNSSAKPVDASGGTAKK
jgi:hypothetical protein